MINRKNTNSKIKSVERCPECGLPADLINIPIIESRIIVRVFRCQNGHQFSKIVDLK